MRKRFFLLIMILFFNPYLIFAKNNIIKGEILDAKTKQPLQNANITIEGTNFGTASDNEGKFVIQNIPPGNYILKANFIGYRSFEKKINLMQNQTLSIEIFLEPTALKGEEVIITAKAEANKAKVRETPISFTTLELKELRTNYTTGDLPQLIINVPGVWTSSAGLGETEMVIRGFNSDKLRFILNGIPMNEAEDQQIYWSNWGGLSNLVRSVQVHRGSGFSLYGSSAFGGSVYIETMGIAPKSGSILRFSAGGYNRMGIISGQRAGTVAHPEYGYGFIDAGKAINYTYSWRLNSGPLFTKKLNMSVFLEYKTGDSYIFGTGYNGYTIGVEAQSLLGRHELDLTFFTSPQGHNQAFTLQDIDLLNELGREYNRKNHEWQENYYQKPFLSLKDEWTISEKQNLVINAFYSKGVGADQTLTNDIFDVSTGKIERQPISDNRDAQGFGEHAMYLLHNFDLWTTDFDTAHPGMFYAPPVFKKTAFRDDTTNFFTEQRTHSWQSRRRRDHSQFGLSTYLQYNPSNNTQMIIGGEGRIWHGHRSSESWYLYFSDLLFNQQNPSATRGETFAQKLQNIYDYKTEVNNFSAFGRVLFKPFQALTIQAGGQYSYSKQKVIENPIQFFDFGTMNYFENVFLRTSADQIDSEGNPKYSEEDYQRTYQFLTPWLGTNWNFTQTMNLFMNFATAKKEPSLLNWYDVYEGPRFQQRQGEKLKPESAVSFEVGVGYKIPIFVTNLNYYHTIYTDKIESVVDFNEIRRTLNAGKAIFQGVELEFKGESGKFDYTGSATFSRNRWQKMDVQEIFGVEAKDVECKVVPFSPELMFNALVGYHFTVYTDHHYRFGISVNYWDRYYGTYTNYYMKADSSIATAKLPYFLDLGAHLRFTKSFPRFDLTFRLDAHNILNRKDNFMRAQYTIDYGRNDYLEGRYHWYVLQAPLINLFFTVEVAIR